MPFQVVLDTATITVSDADVVALKEMVPGTTLTDQQLADKIGQTMDLLNNVVHLAAAAASVWRTEAGSLARLVDVSESGSSRKMSDLYKNAIAMAQMYDSQDQVAFPVTTNRPRTRAIVRP